MMRKIIITILLIIIPFPVMAKGNFILNVETGRGTMTIFEEFNIEAEKHKYDTTVLSIYGGYRFDWGLSLELGGTYHDKDSFLGANDAYTFRAYNLISGFQIPVYKRLKVTPKIGWINWEFETKEGQLFHPGEEQEVKYKGDGLMLAATIDYYLTEKVHMYLGYMETDCKFGEIKAITLGITIH